MFEDQDTEVSEGTSGSCGEWLKKTNNWRPESYCEIDRFAELWDYSISLLADYRKPFEGRYHELTEMYHNCVLDRDEPTEVMCSTETKQLLKERVLKKLKEIAKYNSFADYGYFDMAGFIESKGIYQFPKFWKPSVNG